MTSVCKRICKRTTQHGTVSAQAEELCFRGENGQHAVALWWLDTGSRGTSEKSVRILLNDRGKQGDSYMFCDDPEQDQDNMYCVIEGDGGNLALTLGDGEAEIYMAARRRLVIGYEGDDVGL